MRIIDLLIGVFLTAFAACSASKDSQRSQIKKLQKGIIKDDTSYAYQLPYEVGHSHLIVQGYFSKYSHKNRAALDFKMKKGTNITAARGGVVIRVKEDSDKGGWSKKFRTYGNNIVIQHADSTRAGYWHIQHNGALVNVGDTVKQGQIIALSGKTGYALIPHLHFIVWKFTKGGQWQQVGTRFNTSRGIIYLRPMRRYKNSR